MRLFQKEELKLQDGEIALSCNYPELLDAYEQKVTDDSQRISINNKSYTILGKLLTESYYTASATLDTGTLIVPDEALKNAVVETVYVNIQVNGNSEKNGLLLDNKYAEYGKHSGVFEYCNSRASAYEQAAGMTVMLSYIAVYIGIVFLITCSAVLAIQQLSESSDNQERYLLLRKIGADEKEINKSILKQVVISFMVPLLLAVVHSVVGLNVANRIINYVGHLDASGGIITAVTGIIVVYGGYMIATYFGCKNMSKKKGGML